MKRSIIVVTFVALFLPVLALLAGCTEKEERLAPPPRAERFRNAKVSAKNFNHDLWDGVTRAYVKNGLFDYRGLKADREEYENFAEYIRRLAVVKPKELPNRDARFAFWLNAYNALTVYGVFQQLDVDDDDAVDAWRTNHALGSFWKKKYYQVGGKERTLDWIENGYLRKTKEFQDARLHFAINCASMGCPSLRAGAFTPEKLDEQLDETTRAFFANPKKFRVDLKAKTVHTSKIVTSWYRSDFDAWEGSVDKFFARFVKDDAARKIIASGDYSLKSMDYSWKLNIAR